MNLIAAGVDNETKQRDGGSGGVVEMVARYTTDQHPQTGARTSYLGLSRRYRNLNW
jgi:hypothetical protein